MKYKKCCIHKYPRECAAHIGHREPYDGVRYGLQGNIEIHTLDGKWVRPDRIMHEAGYDRHSSKRKSTTYIPDLFVLNAEEFIGQFDSIFVVDTNTDRSRTQPPTTISIGCVLQYVPRRVQDKNGELIVFSGQLEGLFAFSDCPVGNEERFTLSQFINLLKPEQTQNRFALVTDHALGDIHDFSSRRKPLYGSCYLPDSITLIYASADKTNKHDGILNSMIHTCDAIAGAYLRELLESNKITVGNRTITIDSLQKVPAGA